MKLYKLLIMCFILMYKSTLLGATIQSQIRHQYGNCYESLPNNLPVCRPSTCTYPDFTDSKAWKAITIVGSSNQGCYVMYYSYIDQQIINEPDHCFYNKNQLSALSGYYKNLFRTNSSIDVVEMKDKIAYLGAINCKKNDKDKSKNQ